jgi:hypothetical protein
MAAEGALKLPGVGSSADLEAVVAKLNAIPAREIRVRSDDRHFKPVEAANVSRISVKCVCVYIYNVFLFIRLLIRSFRVFMSCGLPNKRTTCSQRKSSRRITRT